MAEANGIQLLSPAGDIQCKSPDSLLNHSMSRRVIKQSTNCITTNSAALHILIAVMPEGQQSIMPD